MIGVTVVDGIHIYCLKQNRRQNKTVTIRYLQLQVWSKVYIQFSIS